MKKSDVEGRTLHSFDLFFLLDSSRHGETPGDEQIERFIELCREFSNTNPNDIIGKIDFVTFFSLKIYFSVRCSLYTWI